MQLTIIFKSDKSGPETMNFLQIEASGWSVTNSLLCVKKHDNSLRYFPMQNIESFTAQESKNEQENSL